MPNNGAIYANGEFSYVMFFLHVDLGKNWATRTRLDSLQEPISTDFQIKIVILQLDLDLNVISIHYHLTYLDIQSIANYSGLGLFNIKFSTFRLSESKIDCKLNLKNIDLSHSVSIWVISPQNLASLQLTRCHILQGLISFLDVSGIYPKPLTFKLFRYTGCPHKNAINKTFIF